MGNQSTSGIVEEAKATNEAPQKSQEVISPDEEENQTQIQEDDFQEKAVDADSHGAGAGKDVSEEHEGSVNEDCKTRTDIESNLEEGRSMFNNEEHDQLCVLKGISHLGISTGCSEHSTGELQNQNPECEATDITSELQEDQNMLEKEIVEIDDHDAVKKEDDLVVVDTASAEGALSETCPDEAELGENDYHPEEEQGHSFHTLNDVQNISLLESSAAENEKVEENLKMNELCGGGDYVDQNQLPDQKINQFLISCSDAPPEMIKSDIKENGEGYEVEIDSHSGLETVDLLDEVQTVEERDEIILGKVLKDTNELKDIGSIQMEGSTAVTNNEEDDELGDESILKNTLLKEGELSSIEIDQEESEIGITLEKSKSKAQESKEKLEFESNSRYIGVQDELRKSPSFDFGLSFDTRSEESDQTPLLCLDRTPRRSFSSCSNLRFQNRSVQTEYLVKYEAVEVEEKTIRMERSSSEISMSPPLILMEKEGKQESFTCNDKKQEKGSQASPSRDNGATISPRANAKRKPRSSLFSTCICCTAAIS